MGCRPLAETREIESRYDLADSTGVQLTSTGDVPSKATFPPASKSTPPILALRGGWSTGVALIAVVNSATSRWDTTKLLLNDAPGGLKERARVYSMTEYRFHDAGNGSPYWKAIVSRRSVLREISPRPNLASALPLRRSSSAGVAMMLTLSSRNSLAPL